MSRKKRERGHIRGIRSSFTAEDGKRGLSPLRREYFFGLLLRLFSALSLGASVFSVLFLILYILGRGSSVISPGFLTRAPAGLVLGEEGGIAPAITGSLLFSGTAVLLAGIPAIAAALYLVFFCRSRWMRASIRLVIQCISGIPSIVLGLFAYSFLVRSLGLGRCVLSGGAALSIMILPFIEMRAEKAFLELPQELLDASTAMGCSPAWTVKKMVLPYCLGELISALLLGGCFAMGATAPILFTGAVAFSAHPKSLLEPAMALPLHLYLLIAQGAGSLRTAYGTAFVMIAVLLLCRLAAASYARYRERRWRG